MMELAAKGDNSKVDIFIKHLKGGTTEDVYGLFPDECICFNFGHAYGKTIGNNDRKVMLIIRKKSFLKNQSDCVILQR